MFFGKINSMKIEKYIQKHKEFLMGYSFLYGIPYKNEHDYSKDYTKAYDYFLLSKNNGDCLSYYGMAVLKQFSEGALGDFSYDIAFKKLNNDDSNDPIIKWIKALCYQYGDGCEKDINMSLSLYNEAINEGCFYASYELGKEYFIGDTFDKNTDLANYHLNNAYNKGFKNAAYLLGVLYSNEYGDHKEALKFISKSLLFGRKQSIEDYARLLLGLNIKLNYGKILEIENKLLNNINDNPTRDSAKLIYAKWLINMGNNDGEFPNKTIKGVKIIKYLAKKGFAEAVNDYNKNSAEMELILSSVSSAKDVLSEWGADINDDFFTKNKINNFLETVKADLDDFNGYKFEYLCCKIFSNMGYSVIDTPLSGDGGKMTMVLTLKFLYNVNCGIILLEFQLLEICMVY